MRERMMSATRSRTAGLPMYDPPELRAIVDAWWEALALAFRAEGIAGVPDRLFPLFRCWGDGFVMHYPPCQHR